MFGNVASNPLQDAALARVEAEVRARFRLAPDSSVLVTEVVCAQPGCPPLETVIAFWTVGSPPLRHHYKVFKPVQQVTPDDLPPWWMKDALVAGPDWTCSCC